METTTAAASPLDIPVMPRVLRLAQALEDIPGLSVVDGTTVDKAAALLREQYGEVERLQAALKKANNQAEHFEREWYLRGDALEWYRDEAKALAKNMEGGAHTSGVLASLTVLSLDAGRRADAALGHNAI